MKLKVEVEVNRFEEDRIYSVRLQPFGISVGRSFSGSGFRNSSGTSEIRNWDEVIRIAEEMAEAINAAGGLTMGENEQAHNEWCRLSFEEQNKHRFKPYPRDERDD